MPAEAHGPAQPPGPRRQALALIGAGLLLCSVSLGLLREVGLLALLGLLAGHRLLVWGCWQRGEQLAQAARPEQAQQLLRLAGWLHPWQTDIQLARGHLAADQGHWPLAERHYRAVLRHDPARIEAWNGLGFTRLIGADDSEAAQTAFARAYSLRRAPGHALLDPNRCHRLKLTHDRQQWQYLQARGLLPAEAAAQLAALCAWEAQSAGLTWVDPPTDPALRDCWNHDLHRYHPPRQTPAALAPLPTGLENVVATQGHVSWDGLLSAHTLTELQRFCHESTFWHDASRREGYLASTLDDGFCCPLLLQIAAELRAALPTLLGRYRLVYLWAFSCDSAGQGIALHNDSALFNLNFWITPDSANLAPGSGGLLLYPQEPPAEWDFERYRISPESIARWRDQSGAQPVRIAYGCNRAVLFRSRLFHASDHCQFAPGFTQRRINITLLFGERTLSYYPRPWLEP
jgi:hypothetical protein